MRPLPTPRIQYCPLGPCVRDRPDGPLGTRGSGATVTPGSPPRRIHSYYSDSRALQSGPVSVRLGVESHLGFGGSSLGPDGRGGCDGPSWASFLAGLSPFTGLFLPRRGLSSLAGTRLSPVGAGILVPSPRSCHTYGFTRVGFRGNRSRGRPRPFRVPRPSSTPLYPLRFFYPTTVPGSFLIPRPAPTPHTRRLIPLYRPHTHPRPHLRPFPDPFPLSVP